MDGFVRRPGDGDARWFFGNLFVIKVAGADTQGRFAIVDCTSPPGFEPGTHMHAGEDEALYVLEGRLAGHCGGVPWTAEPGDLVFMPRDTSHNFTVQGPGAARYLLVDGPAVFEREVAESPPAEALTLPPRDA